MECGVTNITLSIHSLHWSRRTAGCLAPFVSRLSPPGAPPYFSVVLSATVRPTTTIAHQQGGSKSRHGPFRGSLLAPAHCRLSRCPLVAATSYQCSCPHRQPSRPAGCLCSFARRSATAHRQGERRSRHWPPCYPLSILFPVSCPTPFSGSRTPLHRSSCPVRRPFRSTSCSALPVVPQFFFGSSSTTYGQTDPQPTPSLSVEMAPKVGLCPWPTHALGPTCVHR